MLPGLVLVLPGLDGYGSFIEVNNHFVVEKTLLADRVVDSDQKLPCIDRKTDLIALIANGCR